MSQLPLKDYLEEDADIVVVEPSSLAMFRREYEKFLSADEFERLSDNTYESMEYIYGLAENGVDIELLQQGDGMRVAYHSHCQQRTLGLEGYTEILLDRLGYDVLTSNVECCGMWLVWVQTGILRPVHRCWCRFDSPVPRDGRRRSDGRCEWNLVSRAA